MRKILYEIANICRATSRFLGYWRWLALAVFLFFETGPHIWVSGFFIGTHASPNSMHCTYLGSRGLRAVAVTGCPFLIWFSPDAVRS